MRAGVSSGIATAVDGVAYQGVLLLGGGYGTASALGAVLGAITNFTINRNWTFPGSKRGLVLQWLRYVVASTATYAVLRLSLYVLIELVGLDEHVAWVPAKLVAWALASYPIQRFFVFGRRAVPGAPPAAGHADSTDSRRDPVVGP